MENNKLLIGVQFTFPNDQGKLKHTNIELYVPRDITLFQLIEGIGYGTKKLAVSSDSNNQLYIRSVMKYFMIAVQKQAEILLDEHILLT